MSRPSCACSTCVLLCIECHAAGHMPMPNFKLGCAGPTAWHAAHRKGSEGDAGAACSPQSLTHLIDWSSSVPAPKPKSKQSQHDFVIWL